MQHQAAWRKVELLHAAPCYVRLSINMARILRLRKKKTFRKIRRFCQYRELSGSKSERNTIVIPKLKLKSSHFRRLPSPGSKLVKKLLPNFEHTESRTLGSKLSFPKPECHPILEDPSPIFHHLVETPPNSRLSKPGFPPPCISTTKFPTPH
jgi:hypothetical protein